MTETTRRIDREISSIGVLIPALVITTLSGLATAPFPGFALWKQWTYLVHAAVGSVLAVVVVYYVFVHFRRVTGTGRPLLQVSGLFAFAAYLFLGYTGFHVIVFGQAEALRWIIDWHVLIGYACTALLGVHLAFHRLLPSRRTPQKKLVFSTIGFADLRRAGIQTLATAVVVVAATYVYQLIPSSYATGPAVADYNYPYGDHPFRPGQSEVKGGGFADARQVAGSDACGACHVQIFEEWSESLHGQAASDPTYVTNVSLLAKRKGIEATRYCEGCHSPVATLSGQLAPGGNHAGVKGTLANKEGISCMGCHGIERAIHLKGVASYEFAPATEYLFGEHPTGPLKKLNNFLIRIHPEEHRVTMARPISHQAELCATCHVQYMDKDMNGWGWVKMQDEYSAWLKSHFSGHGEHAFTRQQVMSCKDCHMPLVAGKDPAADKQGMMVSHRTIGANTAIPFLNKDAEQLRQAIRFLQAEKVTVSIDPPWRPDAMHSIQYVNEGIRASRETPYFFYLGDRANLKVTVANTQVGHNFPGGTTDINEVWVYLRVADAEDRTVYESGSIDERREVDKNAYFYYSIPIDRAGNAVWRHDLFNMVGDSYRKIIPAGGSDVIEYTFDVPFWAKGPLTASAAVRYRKFTQQYAAWALNNPDIDLPVVDLARNSMTIPLRLRPDAAAAEVGTAPDTAGNGVNQPSLARGD